MNAGRCLCGGVTWELAAEPFQAFNCHCKLCRKAHGTAFGTYWFTRQGEIRVTGGEDLTVDYRSSHMLVRKFCGECGSVVPYAGEADDQHAIAPGGCHDDGRPSDCNIFVPHGAPWHQVTGDLPRHDDYPPETGYPRVEEDPVPPPPPGIVRGWCMCGSVAFQTTGPYTSAWNCHCGRCRRGRAAAHSSNAQIDLRYLEFTQGVDHLKSFRVPGARYHTQVFCDLCGSKMPHVDTERAIAIVPLGILEDDPNIRPDVHIHVGSRARWHEITDDLEQHDGAGI